MEEETKYKLKPNAQGSSPRKGNISDAALARVTGIPKSTLITWKKTGDGNWRWKHYWFLKAHTENELKEIMKKSKELSKSVT